MAMAKFPERLLHLFAISLASVIQYLENQVRYLRERGNHDDDVVAPLGVLVDDGGCLANALRIPNRGTTELHNDKAHKQVT